jgi:tetraacyldisaccharide 4'-kinase
MMREPAFWWREAGIAARLLAPLAAVYGLVAQARLNGSGNRVAAPVVCIGNLTVGGAGKTPAAIATAQMLKAADELPLFLTRGYGGALAGPIEVDPARHTAAKVGDEPLLLAHVAPTVVARRRLAGAALAGSASVIVMDDGFQNPALRKDLSLLVVDERRGIGNGRVIPAGPLRAPLDSQLAHAHALILVGRPARADAVAAQARKLNLPILRAHLQTEKRFIDALGRGRVLAFAGIGAPDKFFATLTEAGVTVAKTRSFPDHHRFSRAQARALCEEADRDGLILVTTEKDFVRLRGDPAVAELAAQVHAVPVALTFEDQAMFKSLVLERLAAVRRERKVRSPD